MPQNKEPIKEYVKKSESILALSAMDAQSTASFGNISKVK